MRGWFAVDGDRWCSGQAARRRRALCCLMTAWRSWESERYRDGDGSAHGERLAVRKLHAQVRGSWFVYTISLDGVAMRLSQRRFRHLAARTRNTRLPRHQCISHCACRLPHPLARLDPVVQRRHGGHRDITVAACASALTGGRDDATATLEYTKRRGRADRNPRGNLPGQVPGALEPPGGTTHTVYIADGSKPICISTVSLSACRLCTSRLYHLPLTSPSSTSVVDLHA